MVNRNLFIDLSGTGSLGQAKDVAAMSSINILAQQRGEDPTPLDVK